MALKILHVGRMPRPRRAAEGGLIYHALNRANARLAILETDARSLELGQPLGATCEG